MIAIGCDHAGFLMKEYVKNALLEKGYLVKDFGSFDSEPVDYPDVARTLSKSVTRFECENGILICGTGIGMSLAANKFKGIRAAACSETFSAKMTRAHNDSNILCLGARVIGSGVAKEMLDLFITTEYEGGRHIPRVDMISSFEESE